MYKLIGYAVPPSGYGFTGAGASVQINNFNTGAPATLYQDNEVTTKTNPLTADSTGKYEACVPSGYYNVIITYASGQVVTHTKVVMMDPASLDRLNVNHTSLTSASDVVANVTTTVNGVSNNNESISSLAARMILQPAGICGTPSYYISFGSELDVPAAATNRLANSTLYGGKFIVNMNSSATSGTNVAFIIALESELILNASNPSGTTTFANVIGFEVRSEPFTQTGGGFMVIDTYIGIFVEQLNLGARVSINNWYNLLVQETRGQSYFGSPTLVIGGGTAVTGFVTHRANGLGGIRTERNATQDAVAMAGRAGGISSFTHTITVPVMTANWTATLPDKNLTFTPTSARGAVTQTTSRTTAVTINAPAGDITLVSAAGTSAATSFVVNNSACTSDCCPYVFQRSGGDRYMVQVTNVIGGQFTITFIDLTGTTTEQPVFGFNLMNHSVN